MKSKKILAVCSDAGGANCLASFIKHKKLKFYALLDGGAKNIFRDYF